MPPESAARPLVLVVDDQQDNLRFVGEILDGAGFEVMPALSGMAAVARARARSPDLALLDLSMPGIDGLETCSRLSGLPGLQQLPVLFVTGADDRESVTRAFAAGAVDYITKPFVPDELLARVRSHLALKRAREHLQAMLDEREEVTNVVAHDLKNPLTSILFTAQALDAGAKGDTAEMAREIRQCAQEALGYIQRFLARGASDQRLRQFSAAPVQLAEAVREAVNLQKAAAANRAVRVLVNGEGWVQADAMVVRNVVQNLVSNAIRHSPAGGEVTVEIGAASAAPRQCCRVMDRGPGVDPAIAPRLFQRFVHLAAPGSDSSYSSGLGLAIARHDIEQMGGRLWYEPRAGGGSVFAFELPRVPAH